MKLPKYGKTIIKILFVIFIIMNSIAFFHAYKFTHFSNSNVEKTKSPEKLSSLDKAEIVFFGVNNPKPQNIKFPSQKYKTLKLKSNKEIECWLITTPNSKGTVILFHGYGGEKSLMIEKSDEFIKLGFSTMLVDFMGSGNSEGNQTTIGYKEAEEVKTTFDYLKQNGEKDKSVSRKEIDEIYANLKGSKTLNIYKETGHENYLIKNKAVWIKNVSDFFKTL